ncbi:TonB-dependent receptor [Caulobacter sp. 1776]|uniref:TonB-dependent receptor n=1 Tax=Caulobacter sp. 1776 TaxID=3156420 RepID=UPI00339B6D9F
MSHKKGLLAAGASLLALALIPGFGHAQTAAPGAAAPAQDAATVDEVIVTGFRQSLAQAATIKRTASVISDVISAEDIGKFPDQNLADSLQRITGVQITRTNGEGSKISVRGLSPDFTQTLYNGRVLTTPSGGRSFEFSTLASDFVSAVEVYKTPTADQLSGGLAATVNINTAKPLDLGRDRIAMSAEGLYEVKAKKVRPQVAVLVNHLFNDKFAINAGVNYQRRDFRSDTFRGFGFENGVEATRTPKLDYNRDGDFNDTLRFNHEAGTRIILGRTKRVTAIGGFQFEPTDHIEIYGDALYSKYETKLTQPINTLRFTSIICPTAQQGVAPGGCIRDSALDAEGHVIYLDADGVDYRNTNTVSNTYNTLKSGATGFKLEFGRLKVDGEGSYSKARQLFDSWVPTVLGRASASYDFRQDPSTLPQISFNRGYNPLDPTNFRGIGLSGDYHRPINDRNWDTKLDLTFDAGQGFLRSIKGGARYSDRKQAFGTNQIKVTAAQLAGLLGLPVVSSVDGPSFDASSLMRRYTFDHFLNSYDGPVKYPNTFLSADADLLFAKAPLSEILKVAPPVRALANEYAVGEKEASAYLRADFSTADDDLTGNVGLRYVHTDQESSGYAPDLTQIRFSLGSSTTTLPSVTPVSIKRKYHDLLPSLNVRYRLREDLVLRAAAAKVMSRPTLSTLSPSTTVNANTSFITINNPMVDPYRAKQLDVSVEYYFGHGGLLSAAVFYKDVQNFVVSTSRTENINVILTETGATVPRSFTISQPDNGAGGKLKGAEVGVQAPLTFLPGPFDDFGVIANFTYISADDVATVQGGPALALPGVSKYSYNLVGYYENGRLSARLAYNFRSKFVNATASTFGDGSYAHSYGQLDFSAGYDLTKSISLTLDGQNLTDSARIDQNVYGYARGYENVGRRFTAGVRAKF